MNLKKFFFIFSISKSSVAHAAFTLQGGKIDLTMLDIYTSFRNDSNSFKFPLLPLLLSLLPPLPPWPILKTEGGRPHEDLLLLCGNWIRPDGFATQRKSTINGASTELVLREQVFKTPLLRGWKKDWLSHIFPSAPFLKSWRTAERKHLYRFLHVHGAVDILITACGKSGRGWHQPRIISLRPITGLIFATFRCNRVQALRKIAAYSGEKLKKKEAKRKNAASDQTYTIRHCEPSYKFQRLTAVQDLITGGPVGNSRPNFAWNTRSFSTIWKANWPLRPASFFRRKPPQIDLPFS